MFVGWQEAARELSEGDSPAGHIGDDAGEEGEEDDPDDDEAQQKFERLQRALSDAMSPPAKEGGEEGVGSRVEKRDDLVKSGRGVRNVKGNNEDERRAMEVLTVSGVLHRCTPADKTKLV